MKTNNSFLKSYKNLKVLVTGSTGFKGAWLSNWLFLLGSKVVGVGLRPEKDSIIFNSLNLNKKINQYYVDIKNFNKINSVIKKEKPDIIFHLAAQSIVSLSYKNPLETLRTNQKDLKLKFDEDSFDVKRTKQDLDEANNKSKDLDEIIKDAINCVNGR